MFEELIKQGTGAMPTKCDNRTPRKLHFAPIS